MSSPLTCGKYDVVCGRGRSTFLHTGNRRFRSIIECHIDRYSNATSRSEKSTVVNHIMDDVRTKGDFVRQQPKNGTWSKVSERIAREKCGQCLRDVLHSKYRSSAHAKQVRRKFDLEDQSEKMSQMIQSNTVIRSVFDELREDLKNNNMSDETAQSMFDNANSRILEELKNSNMQFSFSEAFLVRPVKRGGVSLQPHPPTIVGDLTRSSCDDDPILSVSV